MRPRCGAVTGSRSLTAFRCGAIGAIFDVPLAIFSKRGRHHFFVAVRVVVGGVLVLSPAFSVEHVNFSSCGVILAAVVARRQPGTSA